MKANYLFFVIGIVFIFAAITYFYQEFLFSLSDVVKAIILFLLAISIFFFGDYLSGRNI